MTAMWVVKAAVKVLGWVSLPPWVLPLAVAGILAASHGFAYWQGRSGANEAWRARMAEARIAVQQRDWNAERQGEAFEAERQREEQALELARQAELQGYIDELRTDKSCRRVLDSRDLGRLRKIDGGYRP